MAAAKTPAKSPAKAPQYVNGLKIISTSFAQRENQWNEIGYSWYRLKRAYNIDTCFTVDFTVKTAKQYTARGLYCQGEPFGQTLLITCVQGCAAIIVLDLRKGSTYMRHNRIILDASQDTRRSLYIPRGCWYGFITLEDNTQIDFKVDNYCSPQFEQVYNMMDPRFGISVPYPGKNGSNVLLTTLMRDGKLTMSARDKCAPWIMDVTPPELMEEGENTEISNLEVDLDEFENVAEAEPDTERDTEIDDECTEPDIGELAEMEEAELGE